MRIAILAASLVLCAAVPAHATEPPDYGQVPTAERSLELGGGVVVPRHEFDQIMAREGGLEMLERMQLRADETRRFEGVAHLVVIFGGVLLFFGASMVYYTLKHARLHRTIRMMVEKGAPLPAELLRAAEQIESGNGKEAVALPMAAAKPVWASNLLWGGLLWVTIGVTGTLYLWLRDSDAWPWGIAALVYGGAHVLTAISKGKVKD